MHAISSIAAAQHTRPHHPVTVAAPAGDYYSLNACQYVLHGGSGCCPRGLTATGMVHRRRRLTGMAAAHGVHPGQPLFAMGVAKAAA
jgi:hypothetical protein